jgi:hypothetical protein
VKGFHLAAIEDGRDLSFPAEAMGCAFSLFGPQKDF